MENNMHEIPASKFQFAQRGDISHDKKLDTKPVGFFKDAWRRFAKNKSSIVGMVIIVILVLFSFIAPFLTRYSVSDTNLYYKDALPKISKNASGGFWDGTKKKTFNAAKYYYDLAIGAESGRNAVVKTYSEKKYWNEDTESYISMFTYRQNSYYVIGYKFLDLTKEKYVELMEYQNKTGKQIIYPMPDTSANRLTGKGEYMFNVNDANYWYKTDNRGFAVLDENGDFINVYRMKGSDDYDSLRIAGDPGIENPTASNRYRYAEKNATGYKVRVCYYDYYVYQNGFEPVFIFGANDTGQDLFVCVASGTRFSLILAVGVAVINLILGAIYGAVEGYYGGKTDLIMERISDILSGIPFMVMTVLFNLHLAKVVGSIGALIFAFVFTGWIGTAGTVRMQFYRFKKQEYVLAARTLGARDRRLIMKHVFPNAMGTIITGAALYVPSVIFSETSLSYLGIINLDNPASGLTSLGTLLSAGQASMTTFPHVMLFPALVISLLMISFNLFGNGLRDAFNPNLRGSEG